MELRIFLVGLQFIAATRAVAINYLRDSESETTAAESAGFDSFGGYGGFKGFHQFNGLMSNAFGDLDGQFDSTGYATSSNRRFDSGHGQHFFEDIDTESFASDIGAPLHQRKEENHPQALQRSNLHEPTRKLPGLRQYLPRTNQLQHSQSRKPSPPISITNPVTKHPPTRPKHQLFPTPANGYGLEYSSVKPLHESSPYKNSNQLYQTSALANTNQHYQKLGEQVHKSTAYPLYSSKIINKVPLNKRTQVGHSAQSHSVPAYKTQSYHRSNNKEYQNLTQSPTYSQHSSTLDTFRDFSGSKHDEGFTFGPEKF